MARVRSRRARDRRDAWDLTPEEEFARGADLSRYRTKLGRFLAQHARDAEDIVQARDHEARLAHLYPEDPR